ncbi:MAG: glycosyltransferase family 2 protein [Oligoflexia bacterium]|nr:glycosyltransferase family 2 protein [Oligoflexia bacterium]
MTNNLAPIALFVFKRPELTKHCLESLSQCRLADESHLTIFCDAAKKPTDEPLVNKVREIIREKKWCKTVTIIERQNNFGLSKSILTGVKELCDKFGKVIVLEDDLVLHPSFLEYMNQALDKYAETSNVMQISGYNYPLPMAGSSDAFFITHSSCWGWGTWKRAWDQFDASTDLLKQLKSNNKLKSQFDMGNAYGYFDILDKQFNNKVDSWGILWYQTIFKNKGLVLFPYETLVTNQGTDSQSTHYGTDGYPDVMGKKEVKVLPKAEKSVKEELLIANYLRGRKEKSVKKIFKFIQRKLGI